jgi:hypothetical protein
MAQQGPPTDDQLHLKGGGGGAEDALANELQGGISGDGAKSSAPPGGDGDIEWYSINNININDWVIHMSKADEKSIV